MQGIERRRDFLLPVHGRQFARPLEPDVAGLVRWSAFFLMSAPGLLSLESVSTETGSDLSWVSSSS